MEKQKFHIEYPTDLERKNQILSIVSAGLTKPKSFLSYLLEMYQQLGFRYLFRDATEILFTTCLALAVMLYGIFSLKSSLDMQDLYSFIFTLSPIFFFALSSLFLVRALMKDTFSVEMTCKYHVFQLAAFRMLIFSLLTMLMNIALIIVLSFLFQSIQILDALLLSCSSLSLFSVLYLYALHHAKGPFATYLMMASWLLVNVLPATLNQNMYSMFLSHVPTYVYGVVLIISIVLYVKTLKKLIAFRGAEGVL
ncbi:hypothetical protein [Fictibacillus sp. 18YEL24]|uniref:hypothetical protein n=1 Tax=Fictibacillus sp. 18YEL24 TaxID=2745875 RepID=UPI0018CEC600|nr:hypothetical protein [Fictibacillus sp. 18YEL24]MBH0169078.1 hypothetical protein [Fictibacillus sp. 18YEL24]